MEPIVPTTAGQALLTKEAVIGTSGTLATLTLTQISSILAIGVGLCTLIYMVTKLWLFLYMNRLIFIESFRALRGSKSSNNPIEPKEPKQ